MNKFFKTAKFKILMGVVVLLAGVLTYLAASGNLSLAAQEIFAAAAVPVQSVTTKITNTIGALWAKYAAIDEVVAENEALQAENEALRRQMVDYERFKAENEQYKAYLQIQEEHPSYVTVLASVIGRDPAERYFSFTIDKGEKDGIEVQDVVISTAGVVGRVVEVGYNYAKVLTILDPAVNVGAIVSRTRDNGVLTGNGTLAAEGLCTLTLLPRETVTTQQDIVLTTGLGGVFPKGLILGTVREVLPETSGKSMYAIIEPATDIRTVKMVFVIINFEE